MSEHTPGPWKPVYNTDYLYEPDEEDFAQKYLLSIRGANGQSVYYTEGGYFKPSPADVALIAAAPELLEALKFVLAENVVRHEGKAREAIAKAEGVAGYGSTDAF